MNYDDESTKNFEEKFLEFVKSYRNFSEEEMLRAKDLLDDISKRVKELLDKKDRTSEDNEELQQVRKKASELNQWLSDVLLLLDEKLFRNSRVIHEAIKKKAEEGDPEVIKAAEKLDESYRKMLDEQLNKN